MKTADLTGDALDWAVAQCEGRTDKYWMNDSVWGNYSPSTRWALGGEIIERENISINTRCNGEDRIASIYSAVTENWEGHVDGETFLVAAMRCYVASKMGSEVIVPDEL